MSDGEKKASVFKLPKETEHLKTLLLALLGETIAR